MTHIAKRASKGLSDEEQWYKNIESWKREKTARRAIFFAVLSSMGVLIAYCSIFVHGGNVRTSPVFWLAALPWMCWYGPLLKYSRWAVVTLRNVLMLFPPLAAGALVLCIEHVPRGMNRNSTPRTLGWIFAWTLITAVTSSLLLRNSSLPGGTRPLVLRPAADRSRKAVPVATSKLFVLSLWIGVTLVSWILFAIVLLDGIYRSTADLDSAMTSEFLLLFCLMLVVVGCVGWGSLELRRTPTRVAPAILLMLAIEVVYCLVQILRVHLSTFHHGGATPRFRGVAVVGAFIHFGSVLEVFRRLRNRAIFFRGQTG